MYSMIFQKLIAQFTKVPTSTKINYNKTNINILLTLPSAIYLMKRGHQPAVILFQASQLSTAFQPICDVGLAIINYKIYSPTGYLKKETLKSKLSRNYYE